MTHFSTISEIPPTHDASSGRIAFPVALPQQKFASPSSHCFDLRKEPIMTSSPPPSPTTTGIPEITREELQRRKHFCIFLKILSHDLAKSNTILHQKVKELVRHCTRKNRCKDPKFQNLLDSLMVRLRALVGEKQWQQCHLYTECYLLSTKRQSSSDTTPVKVAKGLF